MTLWIVFYGSRERQGFKQTCKGGGLEFTKMFESKHDACRFARRQLKLGMFADVSAPYVLG